MPGKNPNKLFNNQCDQNMRPSDHPKTFFILATFFEKQQVPMWLDPGTKGEDHKT